MGTQRVQMKGVVPWLVHWPCRAGTIDFCLVLAALVKPEVNGDSKSTNERGSFVGWFIGLVVPVQSIFALSWLLLLKLR